MGTIVKNRHTCAWGEQFHFKIREWKIITYLGEDLLADITWALEAQRRLNNDFLQEKFENIVDQFVDALPMDQKILIHCLLWGGSRYELLAQAIGVSANDFELMTEDILQDLRIKLTNFHKEFIIW